MAQLPVKNLGEAERAGLGNAVRHLVRGSNPDKCRTAVELSVNSDLMTGFCDSDKICRSSIASNCRLASAIFWCSDKLLLPASDSGAMFGGGTGSIGGR